MPLSGIAVPIVGGRLRGKKWLPAAGGKILRVLGGTYEPEQTLLFEKHLKPGGTLFDVGAHAGYYTLVASGLLGPEGRVIAFEPEPGNLKHLRRHVELNDCANVTIIASAVGEKEGTARFEYGTGTGTGRVSCAGALEVPLTTLDLHRDKAAGACALKIDVEGGEAAVLRGGLALLKAEKPVIFLSTHGPEPHRDCLDLLKGLGYRFEPIIGADLASTTEVLCLPS